MVQRVLGLWITLSCITVSGAHAQESKQGEPSLHSPLEEADAVSQRIAELIEQLGADNYTKRLQAQTELERIGVRALDQLHAASFHQDPQVASTARFMVQSNQFSWAWETDPFVVRQILTNYGSAQLSEKSVYIDQLQQLENDEGFGALSRLVRYETQGSLAKRAALILMRWNQLLDSRNIDQRKDLLLELIEGGRSTASKWVVRYASEGQPNIEQWKQVLAEELKLLEEASQDTSVEIAVDIHKWVVEQIALDPALRQEALQIGRRIPGIGPQLTGNRSQRAGDFAQWALKFSLPELVQDQHAQLSNALRYETRFGYFLAESYLLQGREELANKIAERTLARIPSDASGQEFKQPENKDGTDTINASLELAMGFRNTSLNYERITLGTLLEERGQFQWAEKEYRLAVSKELLDDNTMTAIYRLSKLLHEQGNNEDAAKVIEPFVLRFNKEPMFKKQATEFGPFAESLMSCYHQFLAEHLVSTAEYDAAKSNFLLSIDYMPENVDALIGLYRLPSSEALEKSRLGRYKSMVEYFRIGIKNDESDLKRSTPRFYAANRQKLAHNLNSLAWLIANTEGNREEALFLSRKACDFEPASAAYIDTLSHCYAALDRYGDAVESQRKAVALEPHQPQLKKALDEFEAKSKMNKNSSSNGL